MYVRSPRATELKVEGIHIKQIMGAHATSTVLVTRKFTHSLEHEQCYLQVTLRVLIAMFTR